MARIVSLFLFNFIFILIFPLPSLLAQDEPGKKQPPGKEKKAEPEEKLVVTRHTLTIGAKKLNYTATTGRMSLRNDEGTEIAKMFFIAYTLDNQEHAKRPITFAYNGGPGSSSVWLHMGVLGPKRVYMKEDGSPTPPPYRMVDNEGSILESTDVVLIDPVTTGFSRAVPHKDAKKFHGVQQDISSVGDFIQEYLNRFERWSSPKFLCGESYGTTRSAGLSNYLQSRHGINLNGIILVSAVLNFQTISFSEGNDLPNILFFPSYTATAWYHKKLSPELQEDLKKTLRMAEKFAQGEYTLALMKGNKIGDQEQKDIARKVASLTGLSEKYVLQSNLRINPMRFMRELLRDKRLTVGRFDSRFTGRDGQAVRETPEYDPSYSVVQGPYTSVFNQYVRADLNYKTKLSYDILTGKVQPWDYGNAKNRFLNVAPDLKSAMTENPYLKIYVANGYYDLATPYFASEYTFNHLGLDSALTKNIRMGYYDAGHMMYIQQSSLLQMKRELTDFIHWALDKGK